MDLGNYAVFSRDDSVMPGLIVDISLGGLSFFHHEEENWSTDPDKRYDLFGLEFNVENVIMETVNEFEVEDKSHPIYQLMNPQGLEAKKIRRRGVKFGPLTEDQKVNLEGFIKEFFASMEQHT